VGGTAGRSSSQSCVSAKCGAGERAGEDDEADGCQYPEAEGEEPEVGDVGLQRKEQPARDGATKGHGRHPDHMQARRAPEADPAASWLERRTAGFDHAEHHRSGDRREHAGVAPMQGEVGDSGRRRDQEGGAEKRPFVSRRQ
jgi:hypothetical protein